MAKTSAKLILIILVFTILSPYIFPTNAYIVSTEWVDEIENYAFQVDSETSAEIVVVVLQSLSGHGISDKEGNEINDIVKLGVYIFNELPLETYDGTVVGIGKKGKDNGVLLLVSVDEQKWRIEIGYGLEGDITDVESNRIAQDYLVPQLSQGNYGEGIYDTVVALGQQIPVTNQTDSKVRGTYYYEQDSTPETNPEGTDYTFWIMIILILLGVTVGVPIFRRTGRRGNGGRSGGGGSTGKW